MKSIEESLIWLNKRLNLAIVMVLALWVMAFQKVQMLRYGARLKLDDPIPSTEAAPSPEMRTDSSLSYG